MIGKGFCNALYGIVLNFLHFVYSQSFIVQLHLSNLSKKKKEGSGTEVVTKHFGSRAV